MVRAAEGGLTSSSDAVWKRQTERRKRWRSTRDWSWEPLTSAEEEAGGAAIPVLPVPPTVLPPPPLSCLASWRKPSSAEQMLRWMWMISFSGGREARGAADGGACGAGEGITLLQGGL